MKHQCNLDFIIMKQSLRTFVLAIIHVFSMVTFYLIVVIFLLLLAVIDLSVGVSNDAVNFLNGAIGAKVAPLKTIIIIAAVGVFIGASLSNGMMDIARHGIYQPQHFYFSEIMTILLAVMLTDVVLLDVFNSLGMPTSTTVSLVFELLGATTALSIVKIASSDGALQFGDLLNTDKALTVIIAIFLSVAVAFIFGWIVQWITRLAFSFNYPKYSKYFVGIFGGLASTAIVYFMLIKGIKDTSFLSDNLKNVVFNHMQIAVLASFVIFTILMQALYWMKVNVLKVIVLMGTFSLALAFAANDLVNFVGVPLAGYSSFMDLLAQNGSVSPDSFLMESLCQPAKTPWYFLVGSGFIMVIVLATSKKAHLVVKRSNDLARQQEGIENFGTSQIAGVIVRTCTNMSSNISSLIPDGIRQRISKRFNKNEIILEDHASYDLVRASVNVVLSGLLVALGTSMKLPLSTTYVAFMVAMGSSLADKAWSRESAVYRITGVLSVIGGWFITAGVAFIISFCVAMVINFGEIPAMIICIILAAMMLLRYNQRIYKHKVDKDTNEEAEESAITRMRTAADGTEALAFFRENSRRELVQVLTFSAETLRKAIDGFIGENLREMRKVISNINEEKLYLKQIKRIGTLGVAQLDSQIAIEKGLYYYQSNDFSSEIVYSILHLIGPCKEHVENNFIPLNKVQKEALQSSVDDVIQFINETRELITDNHYQMTDSLLSESQELAQQLTQLKRGELKRLREEYLSTKTSLVYLNIIQEIQDMVLFTTNLLKVSRKFQTE